MSNTVIRNANIADLPHLKSLYIDSMRYQPDNLLPMVSEITDQFIQNSLTRAINKGFAIVLEKDLRVIGYAQGYPSHNAREVHIIKDTRVIIHSQYNSSGYGIKLMVAARNKVRTMHQIKSALFNVRSHNTASARGLEFIGCYEVSRNHDALLKCDGTFMDDIVYRWDNPNFSIEFLKDHLMLQMQLNNNNYNAYDDLSLSAHRTWVTNTSSALEYAS